MSPALHQPRLHIRTHCAGQQMEKARAGQQESQQKGQPWAILHMSSQSCTNLQGPQAKGTGIQRTNPRSHSGVSGSSCSCLCSLFPHSNRSLPCFSKHTKFLVSSMQNFLLMPGLISKMPQNMKKTTITANTTSSFSPSSFCQNLPCGPF